MALVNINIGIPEAKLAEVTAMLDDVKNGSQQVISRAINKVATAARTQIVRRIVEEVNLKSAEVRDRNVSLTKANYSRLEAMIRISGRRIPLLRWGARQTAKGVSYAIRRGGRQTAPGSFMATMPSGHRGVFVRRAGNADEAKLRTRLLALMGKRREWLSVEEAGKLQTARAMDITRTAGMLREAVASAGRRSGRLPISELYGPSVPAVMGDIAELSAETLDEQFAAKLEGEIDSQIGLALARRGIGK